MNKKTAANLFMVLGTMIWGAAFVAQSVAAEHLGPYTLNAIRFFLGGLTVLPVIAWRSRKRARAGDLSPDAPLKKYLIGGFVCGLTLFLGALLQQYGIMYTTVGNAGFLTALYVVMVPVFSLVLFRKRVRRNVWVAIGLAVAGTFLLCIAGQVTINMGDVYSFAGAIFWAAQILCIEKLGQGLDGLKFSFWQAMSAALMNAVFMFALEHPTWEAIGAALLPLLYAGILSVGVGFTAQVVCIQYTDPTIAALIMSLESVFSVFFGWLLLHETLTLRQGVGCVLVFAAVILAQVTPAQLRGLLRGKAPAESTRE